MGRFAKCNGEGCEFFRRYYGVQQHGTGFLPDFKSVDLRCVHPSIYKDKGWGHRLETPGIQICVMRTCPITNESIEM